MSSCIISKYDVHGRFESDSEFFQGLNAQTQKIMGIVQCRACIAQNILAKFESLVAC